MSGRVAARREAKKRNWSDASVSGRNSSAKSTANAATSAIAGPPEYQSTGSFRVATHSRASVVFP